MNNTKAEAPPSRHVVTPIHVMASMPAAGLEYLLSRSSSAELTPNKPNVAGELRNAYDA